MNNNTPPLYKSQVFADDCLNMWKHNLVYRDNKPFLPLSVKSEIVFMINNAEDYCSFFDKSKYVATAISESGEGDGSLFLKIIYNQKDAIIQNKKYVPLAIMWEEALCRQIVVNGQKRCIKDDKLKIVKEFLSITPIGKIRNNVFIEAKEAFDLLGLEGQRFYGLIKNWTKKPEFKNPNESPVKQTSINTDVIKKEKIASYLKENHPEILRSFVVYELSESLNNIADSIMDSI